MSNFVFLGQLLEEYVISRHHVGSWFECSGKCLDSEDCVSLSHRITSHDDTNCMIASETGEIVMGNSNEVDSWTIYEIQKTGSVSNCCCGSLQKVIGILPRG